MSKAILSLALLLSLVACVAPVQNGLANGNCHEDPDGGCTCVGSPILLDMAGDGFRLTSPDDGVNFNLMPGKDRKWSWTAAGTDDTWLVLDRNHNGVIDDGTELFGDSTAQTPSATPNGFAALAVFDANHDGRIDATDPIWNELQLWNDRNADGVSQPEELTRLADRGIHWISVQYEASAATDVNQNEFRYLGTMGAAKPASQRIADVWLRSKAPPKALNTTFNVTCWGWGYYRNYNGTDLCDTPYVQNDPIATDGRGRLSRLVARFAVRSAGDGDTAAQVAADAAGQIVTNAAQLQLIPAPGQCIGRPDFPDPDLYRPGPYYSIYDPNVDVRIKCDPPTSTGGGGGGGSCM